MKIAIRRESGRTVVSVADNGRGLPVEARDRLTEPYVTTREKGTGLGLAIVRKIMEDHLGELRLVDAEGGGAVVELIFPLPDAEGLVATPDRRISEPGEGVKRAEAHGT